MLKKKNKGISEDDVLEYLRNSDNWESIIKNCSPDFRWAVSERETIDSMQTDILNQYFTALGVDRKDKSQIPAGKLENMAMLGAKRLAEDERYFVHYQEVISEILEDNFPILTRNSNPEPEIKENPLLKERTTINQQEVSFWDIIKGFMVKTNA